MIARYRIWRVAGGFRPQRSVGLFGARLWVPMWLDGTPVYRSQSGAEAVVAEWRRVAADRAKTSVVEGLP